MVTKETLDFLFSFLYKESGLVLDESKTYLIETRLMPLAVQEGFSSIEDLGKQMKSSPAPLLLQKVVEAMTTNETSFFRDRVPFDTFKKVIYSLMKVNEKTRRIRIWSACCSTGQEPYSMALTLCEMGADLKLWDIQILATDIDTKVLQHAKEGIYSQYEAQRGLPITYLTRYFNQKGTSWEIIPEVKKFVNFQKLNIVSGSFGAGGMDIIFCRNVLIYFDIPTKKKILDQMANTLAPNGALFLGGVETPLGITDKFTRVELDKGIYYKKSGH
jgi:chemotaxis protein methyltransferase CheR